jgi:hypothetical protein
MNRINPTALGLVLAITAAVLNLVCAGLVAVAPDATIAVFQTWWHGIDVSLLANTPQPMTLKGVVAGLITISAFAFIVGFVFGAANNMVAHRISNFR